MLRYTKALGEERPWSGPPAGHPAEAAGWQGGHTTRHCEAEGGGQPGGGSQAGCRQELHGAGVVAAADRAEGREDAEDSEEEGSACFKGDDRGPPH